MILSFAKPARVMPVSDWKGISADSAPPGVYVPNMSKEDSLLWKAKVVGTRSNDHQIEIRSTSPSANVVVVVNGSMPNADQKGRFRRDNTPHSVKISANGPMYFTPDLWAKLQAAVDEAHRILLILDSKDIKHRNAAIAAVRDGQNPLDVK